MTIAYCCEWLDRLLSRAGEQGMGVIAARDGEHRQFYLQARPLTPHQAGVWEHVKPAESTALQEVFRDENGRLAPVVILMRVPLEHCPSCGRDLGKLIKRNREEFDRLAELHSALVDK